MLLVYSNENVCKNSSFIDYFNINTGNCRVYYGISYPNEKDKENAARHNKSAGGDIKIHGLPNGFSMAEPLFDIYGDWTEGCIAVSNNDMAELYEIIDIDTKIEIKP